MAKKSQFSENRKEDLIVQVCGMGDGPMDYHMYAREADIKTGKWSKWEKINSKLFQAIDKRALKMSNNGDASPFYAEIYNDFIS